MIDDKTQRLSLPLPNMANDLRTDCQRIREAFTLLDEGTITEQTVTDAVTNATKGFVTDETLTSKLSGYVTTQTHDNDKVTVENSVTSTDEHKAASAAAVKEAYDHATVTTVTTFLTPNWNGSEAPWTQTLTIAGVTENSTVIIGVPSTVTQTQLEEYQKLNLTDGGQGDGTVTVKAWGELNASNIPLTVSFWG